MKWAVLVIFAVLVLVGGGYLTFAGPVLYRSSIADACCGITRFVLLSPVRDRSPEAAAEQFLIEMKAGHCEQMMAAITTTAQRRRAICEEENRLHYSTWKIKDRRDQNARQSKVFYLRWSTGDGVPSAAWIDLESHDGGWHVVGYSPIY